MESKPTETPSQADVHRQLLEHVLEEGQGALTSSLRPFLIELGDQLFDLSTAQSLSGNNRHAHFDALNNLKRGSELFHERFAKKLQGSIVNLKKESLEPNPFLERENAKLDLVDLDEMERKLAVDKTVAALVHEHRIALECLTIRTAVLIGQSPALVKTPFHPAYIVEAFTTALARLTDSARVYTDSVAFFRERYLDKLGRIYERLNSRMAAAGIEPGLETEIEEHGSRLTPLEGRPRKDEGPARRRPEEDPAPAPRDEGATAAPASKTREAEGPRPPSPEHDGAPANAASGRAPRDETASRRDLEGMYSKLMSALETSRAAARAPSAPEGATGEGSSAPALDEAKLLAALEKLGAVAPGDDLRALTPLETLVSSSAEEAGGAVDGRSAQRLGFVDNVFKTLGSTYEISESMAPSVARLRVPLAHLSLREPAFFEQADHPARGVVDRLSTLASADQSISPALQKRVAKVLDRLSETFATDSAAFETANEELARLDEQRENAVEKNIERLIEGLEGQQRLSSAQHRVGTLLFDEVSQHETPRPIIDLLEHGWRNSLVQVALREGEDSFAWREEQALIRDLQESFDKHRKGALGEEELRDLRLRLKALGKRIAACNPGSRAHEEPLHELYESLAGTRPAETAHYDEGEPPAPPALTPAKIERLPKLRRWLKRVQDLEVGARLRYRTPEGEERRMLLVWISDDHNRYAFANEQGKRVADLTAIQLARQLSREIQPEGEVDRMQPIDRSIYDTLEEAQKSLSHARTHDAVTRLITGDALTSQVRRCLRHAHRYDSEHALLLIDIDNFALVNEVFDATSGDQVLADFAAYLAERNSKRTLTARFGDDDFGVLLTHRDIEDAREIADALRAEVGRRTFEVGEDNISFTISVGVAPIIQSSESAEEVLAHARDALEIAKSQGRNQVAAYDPDQQERHRYQVEREETQRRLNDAIATNALVLRAQPIVKSAVAGDEGPTHHYELLLALRGNDGQLTSPQDFIVTAERFGYASQVDRWVLKEAFAWISELVDRQKYVPQLSINLSGPSITSDEFLDFVLEQISEYGIGTNLLCFEITETGSIENLPKATDFVRTLKNIGCKFSLDDFGTGLASHTYLKELPVDYVKIDGSFISDVSKNRTDFAMAKSITDLAHFLGQKTIAECVEDLELVPALREIGVDYLQGWGIGMPRLLSDVVKDLPDIET